MIPRYLSAVTCRPWPADLRPALAALRGKLLLELLEALGGKSLQNRVRSGGGAAQPASICYDGAVWMARTISARACGE